MFPSHTAPSRVPIGFELGERGEVLRQGCDLERAGAQKPSSSVGERVSLQDEADAIELPSRLL